MTPGLGPVLIERLVARFGGPEAVLNASAKELEQIQGIGPARAVKLVAMLRDSLDPAQRELDLAARLGLSVLPIDHPDYPPTLREISSAPPLLYIKGTLSPHERDLHAVAVVGSRRCTAYGIEQAERFSGVLAGAGLTIVSGGARGIDTAAHRGAIRSGGRTIAVLGCGLGNCYPPENQELFERVAAQGCVVSELPIQTPPNAENFPARNRIISGLALGVLVIEAGEKSGALITARQAGAEHNREVMVVPGRVDSPSSRGSHELLKKGEGLLVTEPGDVLELLRTPAGHQHAGTHASRYGSTPDEPSGDLFEPTNRQAETAEPRPPAKAPGLPATPAQGRILAALEEPCTIDQLATRTGMALHEIRAELTMLEIQRRVRRDGPRLHRA